MSKQVLPPKSDEVKVKFTVDASSKDASDRLEPDNFIESVKEMSRAIVKKPPTKK